MALRPQPTEIDSNPSVYLAISPQYFLANPYPKEIASLPVTARIELRLKAILFTAFSEVAGCGLHCAHRATTVYRGGSASTESHTSYLAISF
jgi:hypothetical protein